MSTSIEFKNMLGVTLSEQQAKSTGEFEKLYIENFLLRKKERVFTRMDKSVSRYLEYFVNSEEDPPLWRKSCSCGLVKGDLCLLVVALL